tara:strand:- start:980 stop:1501 length:522 start_codon:yes stop_codon:yes gene_type:complete
MRLFVAFDLGELDSYFIDLQKKLPKEMASFRLTESFHITLKFLGDVMPQYIENYKKMLKEIKVKPFTITFNKLGYFSKEKIHVVWAGLEDNRKVMKFQSDVDNSLRKYFPKTERFHPHVTLGRVKKVYNAEGFKEKLKEIAVSSKEFRVKGFKLIMSTLTSEGPIYEDVGVFE